MRKLFFIATISLSLNSLAVRASESFINPEFLKINKSFKDYCFTKLFPNDHKKNLSPDLAKLKKEILDYTHQKNLEPNELEIKNAWNLYLESNFRSRDQLDEYLVSQNLDLEELQKNSMID